MWMDPHPFNRRVQPQRCCKRLLLPAPVSPQSIGVRAPVFRVTRFGPQLNLVPLLIGISALSPPGQKLFASHLLHRVPFGAGS